MKNSIKISIKWKWWLDTQFFPPELGPQRVLLVPENILSQNIFQWKNIFLSRTQGPDMKNIFLPTIQGPDMKNYFYQ